MNVNGIFAAVFGWLNVDRTTGFLLVLGTTLAIVFLVSLGLTWLYYNGIPGAGRATMAAAEICVGLMALVSLVADMAMMVGSYVRADIASSDGSAMLVPMGIAVFIVVVTVFWLGAIAGENLT